MMLLLEDLGRQEHDGHKEHNDRREDDCCRNVLIHYCLVCNRLQIEVREHDAAGKVRTAYLEDRDQDSLKDHDIRRIHPIQGHAC